jgi:hypothetical protein
MRYIVTFGNRPTAIGSLVDLQGVLADACDQIARGDMDVAIQDGSGKSIRGEELAACCPGEKTLTSDLTFPPPCFGQQLSSD